MENYRAAVIGLGRMGSTFDDEIGQGGSIFLPYCHAPSYDAAPNVELVAGADPHDGQRRIFGDRWGISQDHLYADYREMLARENLDLVSVCTTARVRSGIVQDVARSGVRAIWAEKPIALSLREADEMIAACEENDVRLAVYCGRRWNPLFHKARQMIQAGDIGDVLQVTAYTQAGLSHNGSHAIDIVRYLAGGEIEWVFGEIESDEAAAGDDDPRGNGYLAFDNGARAYIRTTATGAASWDIDVIGTEGRIRSSENGDKWELQRVVAGGPTGRRGRPYAASVPFPWPPRIQGMGLTAVADIVSAVENGHEPRCSGYDGRAALEVAVALRESHRRGGVKVALPIEDRSMKIDSIEIAGDDVPARVRRERERRSKA